MLFLVNKLQEVIISVAKGRKFGFLVLDAMS